jgi:hypothetical protein
MYCDYCGSNIDLLSTIYKGFDCNFCSKLCRCKISEINYKNDPNLSSYSKWYNYKTPPLYLESTLKRTTSIIDFQNRNNKNYPKYINYFDKKNILSSSDNKYSKTKSICTYLNISYKTRLITYIIKFISFKIMY